MVGAVEGVRLNHFILHSGTTRNYAQSPQRMSIMLFLDGVASVLVGQTRYYLNEIAVFVPRAKDDVVSIAAETDLTFMEILIDLSPEDSDELTKNSSKLPFLRLYSQCQTYQEDVKSEKTISRSIVPVDTIPRFCMGSVQTDGPDMVAKHMHEAIEQLFLSLENNNATLSIGKRQIEFGANILVHIPPRTEHSVQVREGSTLHYIWMDFFLDKSAI